MWRAASSIRADARPGLQRVLEHLAARRWIGNRIFGDGSLGRRDAEKSALNLIRRTPAGSLRMKERFELRNRAQGSERMPSASREQIGRCDLALSDCALQIAERRVHELPSRGL